MAGLRVKTASPGGGASALGDLTDVDTTTVAPTDGQTLVFDDADNKWKPDTPAAGASAFVGARVYRSAAYSLVHATVTAFPFDAEAIDTDGFHDNVTNNSRLTVPTGLDGTYLVGGTIQAGPLSGNALRFFADVSKNGSDIAGGRQEQGGLSGSYPGPAPSVVVDLVAGDYVELRYYQTVGSSQTAVLSSTGFWIARIGT